MDSEEFLYRMVKALWKINHRKKSLSFVY